MGHTRLFKLMKDSQYLKVIQSDGTLLVGIFGDG